MGASTCISCGVNQTRSDNGLCEACEALRSSEERKIALLERIAIGVERLVKLIEDAPGGAP